MARGRTSPAKGPADVLPTDSWNLDRVKKVKSFWNDFIKNSLLPSWWGLVKGDLWKESTEDYVSNEYQNGYGDNAELYGELLEKILQFFRIGLQSFLKSFNGIFWLNYWLQIMTLKPIVKNKQIHWPIE